MAKPSYQHLENPLLRGARYDLFSVFLSSVADLYPTAYKQRVRWGVLDYLNSSFRIYIMFRYTTVGHV